MKLLFTAFVIFASLAIGNPTVSIIDYGTGSSTVMTPGDAFAVNIYGGTAYGAVTVLVNGSWLGNEGNADVNGHFVFNSTVPNNPGEVDDQVWSISGVPATPNPLHFTIGNAIPI